MGLTKQYLRYCPAGKFNIIASKDCNICFVTIDGQEGRYLAVGACEDIILWDLRLGQKHMVLTNNKLAEVTHIAVSPDRSSHILVAGYSDGSINVFDLTTAESKTIFHGHKSAITSLTFDEQGYRLASGSKDTEIIIWDIIQESGIVRLSGHKGVITSTLFVKKLPNILISSSKDTLIKFWNLDTSHCFRTITGHVTEVWCMTLAGEDEQYLIAGSNDAELRVWLIRPNNDEHKDEESDDLFVDKKGSILRSGKGRTVSIEKDVSGQFIIVNGTDSVVELFKLLTESEAKVKWKKRMAKERKKAIKNGIEITTETEISLKDVVKRMPNVKFSAKVKSPAIICGKQEIRIAASLNNNKIELWSVDNSANENIVEEYTSKCLRRLSTVGHQGEVRALAFSSDNLAIVSVGSDSIKMWNRTSMVCLRTILVERKICLSVIFVPGDRHALVGTKDGSLLIVDLAAGDILETIPAHSTEVWSVILSHDKTGAFTGGGDSTVKEWKFELITNESSAQKILSLLHTRTLKLDDSVLCVRVSPDGKFIAAALLDSTVRLFFSDTFKFFVSLYGHKLPVLSLDFSYDCRYIVTGSLDRHIKIWGTDFGDCHKSIFAHDESVQCVAFVPKTHYLFSIGKDGKVKEWDADTFDKIITLDGHLGEGWNLAVGGSWVVSCGQDRVIRLFEKSDEPLVLLDEQEEERAKEEEEQLATDVAPAVNLPSIRTVSSERGADLLLECINDIDKYESDGPNAPLPPLMAALKLKSTNEYLIRTLRMIRPSELGEVVTLLQFHEVKKLAIFAQRLLKRCINYEMAAKVVLLIIKIHPLIIDSGILDTTDKILEPLIKYRDLVGLNLYSLAFLQREMEEKEGIKLFLDATQQHKEKDNRKRKKELAKRSAAVLTLV